MTSAYERVRAAFEAAGCTVIERGNRFSAQTPGHSAADRGCTVKQFDGGVTFSVYNDDRDRVMDELGLTMRDLWDKPKTFSHYNDGRVMVRSYDQSGKGKTFRPVRNPTGRALYRVEHLPDDLNVPVFVCEGEKDCEIAATIGIFAVSQASGAKMPTDKADWKPLRGRPVTIVADIDVDNPDRPGRIRAENVYRALFGIASSVRIVQAARGNDLGDHVGADLAVDELLVVDTAHLDAAYREFSCAAERWAAHLAEVTDTVPPRDLFEQWLTAGRELRQLLAAAEGTANQDIRLAS